MDPHAFEGEETPSFRHHDSDAENSGKSLSQLGRLVDLDQAIATLLGAGGIGALVGDQVGRGIWFLSQLQPSPWNLEIGISLDQRPFVLGPEPSADFDGSGGVAISRLQLQISTRSPDAATLAAHRQRREGGPPPAPSAP